jgi:hypothetical protein
MVRDAEAKLTALEEDESATGKKGKEERASKQQATEIFTGNAAIEKRAED